MKNEKRKERFDNMDPEKVHVPCGIKISHIDYKNIHINAQDHRDLWDHDFIDWIFQAITLNLFPYSDEVVIKISNKLQIPEMGKELAE